MQKLLLGVASSAGDLRRANGLLARYGTLLLQHGGPSILIYNLLMKVLENVKSWRF